MPGQSYKVGLHHTSVIAVHFHKIRCYDRPSIRIAHVLVDPRQHASKLETSAAQEFGSHKA